MAKNNAQKQLHDILVSKNFEPNTLDSQGRPAAAAEDAEVISFDYIADSGKNYGTVVVMFDADNNMEIYFGDNVGKGMETEDKKGWFDFLYQLRQFAKRNLMSFGLKNLNRLKYSMAQQAQANLKESIFESWAGTSTRSWNGAPTEARLMIKHKRVIGENDARFRYIESLFVETAEGERFRLPFTKLAGGRAMVEHVRNGGRPYDARGQHITNIVEELNLLSQFKRANQGRVFEGSAAAIVETAVNHYKTLQHNLKALSTTRGYTQYFESWNASEITDADMIIEDLRSLFVEQRIDTRIEQALPVLARLQHQENAMKEINVFEGWVNLISEGTWSLPDTPQKQQQLTALLSKELPVGPDATNATELLYDLLGDDELFDQLQDLARENADADARTIILNRLEQMASNPDVAQVIGQLKVSSGDGEVKESFNTYNIDQEACPKCDEHELTYNQGSNHVSCGSCGAEFDTDGNQIDTGEENLEIDLNPHGIDPEGDYEDEVNEGMQRVYYKGQWVDPKTIPHGIKNEAEQLDELSPQTLKSYVRRASSDRAMRNFDQGFSMGKTIDQREPDFGSPDNDRKDTKRLKGINKALNRLEEGRMGEIAAMYDEWLTSEYAPHDSDSGDDQAVIAKAVRFLAGKVAPEKIEDIAELMAHNFHGGVSEGLLGSIVGGIGGAVLGKSPTAASVGAKFGSAAQDTLGLEESKYEIELYDRKGNLKAIDHRREEYWTDSVIAKDCRSKTRDGWEVKCIKDGKPFDWKAALEVAETVGGGNFLNEERSDDALAKMLYDVNPSLKTEDEILDAAYPLAVKMFGSDKSAFYYYNYDEDFVSDFLGAYFDLQRKAGIREGTALQGQYGHSGKMESVKGIDQDMMDRIKFLAGVRK